jgi:peptidoglycan/xylan/chitin deacetylase (PgdA/CDA1 family)
MVTIKNAIISGASLAALASGHAVGKRAPSGQIITSCTVPGTIALTFDDGPYIYSQEIVDALTAAGHRATFFQNGNFIRRSF